ncbi:hypothetical protein RN001_009214 [Aquatica leii]|uniref:Uncharacterized protein n=1 Tax=Aquatica leii TaxID=1421715 RepID=A0AAN7QFZ6_9COLE|nr:hypothetical protein RN001_009214 [Aquatica leii]
MDEDKQYDYALGGNQKLPPRVKVLEFAADRINEMKAMEEALKTTTASKLVFQQLPKHMRRRVMAHNSKRLPRRLRQIHLSQFKKSGMPLKQKRPSRKHRRRPRNLLSDYANRQRRIKWLETHIWHAKRFHMIEKWGFRIANKPCDKAFRACYRATAKHCLIQDVSYVRCIQLRGNQDVLVNTMKSICISNSLSVGAKIYLTGNREGTNVMLGEKKPLGTFTFHWQPASDKNRVLWIWVHAAYYAAILNVLKDSFGLKLRIGQDHVFINENTQVELTELKDSLNRFKLTGPLSSAVLYNACKIVNKPNSQWFAEYIENLDHLSRISEQHSYWNDIQNSMSVHELMPNHILCLIVNDPRYNLPRKKTKALPHLDLPKKCIDPPSNLGFGAIWEEDVRIYVKKNKISNAKLNELRSELLVGGTSMGEGEAVPIMLIQNPGSRNQNLGYSSGWDLIVPSGWGNAFWQTLIMWGARAGGLREFTSILFENGQLPFLTPDTPAGHAEEKVIDETYKQRYFSLPPNKRPNYNKLGVVEPFTFNWLNVINEWKLDGELLTDQFSVLRDKNLLKQMQVLLRTKTNRLGLSIDKFDDNLLVPVHLRLHKQGTVKQFARICLPEPKDLSNSSGVFEPKRADLNQNARKEKRDLHKKLLKKLRHERTKARKQGRKLSQMQTEELSEFAKEMRKLWLPDLGNAQLRTSCARLVMGYVVYGDFSFTQSCSCGVGYISIGAFKVLLQQKVKNKVLVRNVSCRKYRIANVDIVI